MTLLHRLRGGLIVSVQALPGSAIDDPHVIAAMARAAAQSGAVAVRIAGERNLAAVRAAVMVPVVGLIKREYPGYEPYITPSPDEVAAVVAAGAQIVALDATPRSRPGGCTLDELIAQIHAGGALALADCATAADGIAAATAGADAVATTLCGYTAETEGHALPALDLVVELTKSGRFTICEGGIRLPAQVRAAVEAGADAVCVGSAITNVDWLVREFAGATGKGF